MKLSVSHSFLPKTNSVCASIVMDHFGIDFETGRHIIAKNLDVPIEPGQVVLFTGASGSGKSSLLRAATQTLRHGDPTMPPERAAGLPCVGGDLRSDGASRSGDRDTAGVLHSSHPVSRNPHPVVNIDDLLLSERLLIDAWDLPVAESMALLSACGMGEAQLLLRTPAELSEGQRYRFRLASALAQRPDWIVADEFTATLDRTLAKVVAFNVRRLADRTGTGFLLATTHEDLEVDLAPDVHVRCRLDGTMQVLVDQVVVDQVVVDQVANDAAVGGSGGVAVRSTVRTRTSGTGEKTRGVKKKRAVSFTNELEITLATRADWPYFARWHYRGHGIGRMKFATLLWHGAEPIGLCLFTSPPLSLRPRNRFFGRSGRWERTSLRALNRQLVQLSRVVMHPTYRGAGIAAAFVRRSCELSGFRWIETLAQMGHINPFFEKAGFVRVGTTCGSGRSRADHSAIYGGRRDGSGPQVSEETYRKSRYAAPVYYMFDNRGRRRS